MRRWLLLLSVAVLIGGCVSAPTRPVPEPPPPAPPPPAPAQRAAPPSLQPPPPLAPSPDGRFVAWGKESLVLYDQAGEVQPVPIPAPRQFSWSPDGRALLVAAAGPSLLLVDPAARSVRDLTAQFRGLRDTSLLFSWAPDGGHVLVAQAWVPGSDPPVPIWVLEVTSGQARKVTDGGRLVGVQWIEGGKALLQEEAGCCGSSNRVIRLSDGATLPDEGFFSGGAFAPNGRDFALTPYMGAALIVRDISRNSIHTFWKGTPPGDPPLAEDQRYHMSEGIFSPDSRYLAYPVSQYERSKLLQQTLRIADMSGATPERVIRDWVPGTAWLPDGRLLYATQTASGLAVHLGEHTVAELPGATSLGLYPGVPAAVLSADGKRLAYVVSRPGKMSELHVTRGDSDQVIPSSSGLVPLLWTADGTKLLVGRMPYSWAPLPGGGSTAGREADKLEFLPLPP